ncbi:hypothetical protein [Yinghuangia seranimata]|uniref:hypothetical protein n=1 Tax=Yinghuangia seranimata TaxID=408067 RepID=UPI00248CC191|nr:hypothetical protein [Yinghuangia seranimata]MDI2129088.1 hypothetical protein [Yinghuangia seranimata]
MRHLTPQPAATPYELRYGRSIWSLLTTLGIAAIAAAAAVSAPVPTPVSVGMWVFVGICGVLGIAIRVTRRVALRADAAGLTIHRFVTRDRTVPWQHVTALVLWRQDSGVRCVGILATPAYRAAAGPGFGDTWYNRAAEKQAGYNVSRLSTGWDGDLDDLRELVRTIAAFAPHVHIVDNAHRPPITA